MSGGKHIQFLLKNNLLVLAPSPIIDGVYANQNQSLPSTPEPTMDSSGISVKKPSPSPPPGSNNSDGETMLLSQANGRKMAQALDLPQLEVELERAIWQVETAVMKRSAEVAATQRSQGVAEEDEKKSQ